MSQAGPSPTFVRDRVLDDDRAHALGMRHGQPHADRAAVVLLQEDVVAETDDLGEIRDHSGEMVEGVGEFGGRRRVALAEARIVRRDQMITVGEQRDQRREHPRRRRIAVQHEDRRRIPGSRLAIENLQPVDRDEPIGRRRGVGGDRLRARPGGGCGKRRDGGDQGDGCEGFHVGDSFSARRRAFSASRSRRRARNG